MDENKILHIEMLRGVRIDYEDALDNLLVMRTYSKGRNALKLIDARKGLRIEKKARALSDHVDAKKTIARAIVINSTLSKLILTFINELNQPQFPTKIFTNYRDAYYWLMTFKEENLST